MSQMLAYQVCPDCGGAASDGVYDLSFIHPDECERSYFGVPAVLCAACQQLFLDAQLLDRLGLRGARCTFAIENDRRLLDASGLSPRW